MALMHLLMCVCTSGVVCGAAASGHYVWNDPTDIGQLLLCCMMSGPLLTGYTQTINDYYDREIDAINEPYRPIPSGGFNQSQCITADCVYPTCML